MDAAHCVLDAIRNRRSIRKYTDAPVTDDELTSILEAGRWAPSGLNNQPWRFLVLSSDDERVAGLAEHTKYAHVVRAATALICVFLDRDAMYNEQKDHQGIGACVQNMLLAAHALGLGAVWLGEIINQEPEAMAALGLDAGRLELNAVLALGRPDQKGSSTRKELSELMLEEL